MNVSIILRSDALEGQQLPGNALAAAAERRRDRRFGASAFARVARYVAAASPA